jgi:branched-chain amino acid transport system permease protein
MRPKGNAVHLLAAAAVMVFLIAIPGCLPPFWARTLAMIFLFIYWSSAWNIVGGMAGEINFLHPLFIGAGAYVSTLLYLKLGVSPWIGMFAGALLASGTGLAIGWVCYKSGLPHLSFALITMGFTEMGLIVALSSDFLGGTRGISIRPAPGWANMQFASLVGNYYMGLVMACLMLGLCWRISRSKLGYYLKAIRDNETAASAIGINTVRCRLVALVVSAFFTAIGGTFYAQSVLFIDPHSAVSVTTVITIILFCALGGFGTVWGPLVGTVVLMPIGEILRIHLMTGFHLIVYGLVVIVVILLAPRGLVPLVKEILYKEG